MPGLPSSCVMAPPAAGTARDQNASRLLTWRCKKKERRFEVGVLWPDWCRRGLRALALKPTALPSFLYRYLELCARPWGGT
mgnify:CR=1 FL=1